MDLFEVEKVKVEKIEVEEKLEVEKLEVEENLEVEKLEVEKLRNQRGDGKEEIARCDRKS